MEDFRMMTIKIRTPKIFAVITLEFEQDGFTIE